MIKNNISIKDFCDNLNNKLDLLDTENQTIFNCKLNAKNTAFNVKTQSPLKSSCALKSTAFGYIEEINKKDIMRFFPQLDYSILL